MPKILQKMRVPSRYRGPVLVITVFISAILLVAVNYVTIKSTSSVRAYIHGESHYSKGQKDAMQHLMLYLVEHEEKHYETFKKYINIPVGDSLARVAMVNKADMDVVEQGFLQGQNHPDDLKDLIWLYDNFGGLWFFREPIEIWEAGDRRIGKIIQLGEELHAEIEKGDLSRSERSRFMNELTTVSGELTLLERAFSDKMGKLSRSIARILFVFNTIIILIILGVAVLLVTATFTALQESRRELKSINRGLIESNKQLDSFIYASSHDLKSPISNLEGLLRIFSIRAEIKDPQQQLLLDKMKSSIDNLKQTIGNIENLIRIDRSSNEDVIENNFEQALNHILEQNEMSFLIDHNEIRTDFKVKKITYSKLALKSIMYNMVSNAVKYQSPRRKLQLSISTYYVGKKRICLEFTDNGMGIDLNKHGKQIFSMFKRFHTHETGSGLGLYAVKQVLEKNGGEIQVESEVDKGTTFRIIF